MFLPVLPARDKPGLGREKGEGKVLMLSKILFSEEGPAAAAARGETGKGEEGGAGEEKEEGTGKGEKGASKEGGLLFNGVDEATFFLSSPAQSKSSEFKVESFCGKKA